MFHDEFDAECATSGRFVLPCFVLGAKRLHSSSQANGLNVCYSGC
jgi:hypothetical protein